MMFSNLQLEVLNDCRMLISMLQRGILIHLYVPLDAHCDIKKDEGLLHSTFTVWTSSTIAVIAILSSSFSISCTWPSIIK